MKTLVAALMILGTLTGVSAAESYNLKCTPEANNRGNLSTTLTIRGRWSPFFDPTIRVVSSRPGETLAVTVEAYSSDQIAVSFPMVETTPPYEDVSLKLTVDRNTGAARFQIKGPWRGTLGSNPPSRYRETKVDLGGQCEREAPRF
jgi:hypothetical protein